MENIFQNKKVMGIIGIVIVLISVGFILFTIFDSKDSKPVDNNKTEESENVNNEVNNNEEVKKELSIIDVNSNSRPVAVMINNINAARPYHSGLGDAYIVYEIIVEGGITRMMALFKDKDTAKIGSVRSSRHYYLDYALENDAIYVHFGWSPQAESDIAKLGVNNINGLYDSAFWRDTSLNVAYEHTAYTNMEKIMKDAKNKASYKTNKGYRLTSDKDTLLNYTTDEVDLTKYEDSVTANSIDIKYSNYLTTSYIYNPKEKLYYRNVNNKSHTDYVTKKQYTTKNIFVNNNASGGLNDVQREVIYDMSIMTNNPIDDNIDNVSNSNVSNDSKGRQNLDNIGTGTGFYITNGLCIPITWEKKSRTSQTVYKYKDGTEINVSDGNAYIQIAPKNSAKVK